MYYSKFLYSICNHQNLSKLKHKKKKNKATREYPKDRKQRLFTYLVYILMKEHSLVTNLTFTCFKPKKSNPHYETGEEVVVFVEEDAACELHRPLLLSTERLGDCGGSGCGGGCRVNGAYAPPPLLATSDGGGTSCGDGTHIPPTTINCGCCEFPLPCAVTVVAGLLV